MVGAGTTLNVALSWFELLGVVCWQSFALALAGARLEALCWSRGTLKEGGALRKYGLEGIDIFL